MNEMPISPAMAASGVIMPDQMDGVAPGKLASGRGACWVLGRGTPPPGLHSGDGSGGGC